MNGWTRFYEEIDIAPFFPWGWANLGQILDPPLGRSDRGGNSNDCDSGNTPNAAPDRREGAAFDENQEHSLPPPFALSAQTTCSTAVLFATSNAVRFLPVSSNRLSLQFKHTRHRSKATNSGRLPEKRPDAHRRRHCCSPVKRRRVIACIERSAH